VQHITFVDKTAPVLSGPTTPIAATTSCSGLPKVTYTVTAKDNCGGTPTPSCIPTSGSAFVVGTTHVSCQAVDNCGNPGYFGFDVSVTEGTDSACGAFTIGFWQNKNGQAKITGANQTALRAYLASFKPFCDLGSQTIATYVYNIVKAANASGTTMNAMLKAQMLATALNVYFSPTLGNLDIDITQICKCIDSTTGTATCSGRYNTSAGFAGLPTTCQSVNALLAYAASQFLNTAPYSCASPSWYGSNKTIQQSSKDTFDSINNGFALICGP